ncbi:peptidoglycan/LPS O-acetylase OafA/YrhL [Algoriphagus sp. 4150]|uniref:acyltransferase family protein n=1 Tax=Algoriphagus sp. 4150 TaxID=2817756 RepID=UPI0028628A2E|nr:acyltransferase family protein [Algoriphagus sp. 4150]MDR7128890.1 peptidoglycan/LPS O-acetylase OafA/YrhL [Algoriphagus sp. 4150]
MKNPTPITGRRYDIDWLRVIAIGLLLIYHVSIGFQSWGRMVGFITSDKPWAALWWPMALLNIWRIPLLFFVSGMGLYFAMQSRNWSQLIWERTRRILLPFVFGIFAIVPLHLLIWRLYYGMDLKYSWAPGHLWFLGNIFSYLLLLSPVFYLIKKNETGKLVSWIKKALSKPTGLLLVLATFVAEAVLINPLPFELYAMTWHGFILGLLAFFFGFCFVLSGASFWKMIQTYRWIFLITGLLLFGVRISRFASFTPAYLLAIESFSWILAVFAFGSLYLKGPSKTLSYLSQAAYPVYILHMVFLYLASLWIFPLTIPVQLQFGLVLLVTFVGSFSTFELIRRVSFLRPLFGLKQ